jgi:two-component system sensor histidine kinase HydH
MKTVVQALLDDDAITERTRRYLGRMEREIDRLTNFLRGFQGVSGPPEARPVACRLDEVLDDVLLWTRKEAKGRGIRIGYAQCASAIPKLWADPNQLKQLLLNLVINAVHAVDRGGQVNVGMCLPASIEDLRGRNPRIRFCVEDDGCGIPPDVLPRIFDPFFTTRESGTGLGLAIVKKIATQHGADIVVRSVPGKGTRVELVWPIAPLEPGERLEDFIAAAPGRCDRAEHAFDA